MTKFKIGDKVRNLHDNDYVRYGTKGIIKEVNEYPILTYRVAWEDGGYFSRYEHQLELLQQSDTERAIELLKQAIELLTK